MPHVPSKQVLRHLTQFYYGRASTSAQVPVPQCGYKRQFSVRKATDASPSLPLSSSLSSLSRSQLQDTTPFNQRCLKSRTPVTIPRQRRTLTTSKPSFSSPNTAASANTTESPLESGETASLPDVTNYYTLFPLTIPHGAPSSSSALSTTKATFSISLPALRKEFLRLQSQYHPDKYDPSTPAHQKALALSSFINNAYKTLSDPLLRAQYLLQLNYDIDVTSEDNAAHPTDQETLMQVMEAQERVEEAGTQQEVDLLKDENTDRIQETVSRMSDAFETGDVNAAKSECVRLKYWNSLQQGLHDWEPGKEVRLIH